MADKINYLASDFETIRNEINAKLSVLDGWRDLNESSVGSILVRLFSYVADMLLYRINVLSNENFLDLVSIKDNLLKIVKLLNYKVRRAIPSYGEVKLYLKNPSGSNIIIPKGTKLSTNDGILFYTMFEEEIIANETEIVVNVVQGVRQEVVYYSNGKKNQEFILNQNNKNYYIGGDIFVSDNYKFKGVTVYVDDEEWTEIDSLVNATSEDKVYYF